MNAKSFFIVIGIIAIAILGFMAYKAFTGNIIIDVQDVGVGINPARGIQNASVTIIEFSDFECPACGAAQPVIDEILQDYEGRVSFYYRHFPLVSIHDYAYDSALAAQAANEQGKFWEYHDLLFDNQDRLDNESLISYASNLGLDLNKFNEDRYSEAIKAKIQKDIDEAVELGIRGTPTFFINGKMILGANDASMRELIEEELRN